MNRRNIKRITAVLVAFIVAMAVLPAASYARTITTTPITSGMSVAQFVSKTKAAKTGNTTIKVKAKAGYIKFKATKNKTYTFTVDKVKQSNDVPIIAWVVAKIKSNATVPVRVRTNEGKREALFTTTAKIAKLAKENGITNKIEGKTYKYLSKRYVKIALKKGQTIYLCFKGGTSGSCRLNIK